MVCESKKVIGENGMVPQQIRILDFLAQEYYISFFKEDDEAGSITIDAFMKITGWSKDQIVEFIVESNSHRLATDLMGAGIDIVEGENDGTYGVDETEGEADGPHD